MLRKIKIKNSTILFSGIIIFLIGIGLIFFEYFEEKKDKAFSEKSIMLYESEIPENIEENSLPEEKNEENEEKKDNESTEIKETRYSYIGTIEIPKLNIKNGFVDINSRYNNVNYNVTVIQGSIFPDNDKSNVILAAHSGICPVCYFDTLYKLNIGDIAYINYKQIEYKYKLVDIYEVEKDGTVTIYRNYSKNGLVLITCTRNSDTKQTVYIFEMQ